ncbi:MAG: hypothetical protein Q8R07_00505, partial [Candidatus Uhrbacteria bacterium]|nr:hypothetical protein [Candidatus Uhrbacteria bacterium]
ELLLNFAMFFVGVSAGFLSGILIVLGVVSAASKEFADGSGALLFVMITLLLTTILGGFSGYFIDSYTAWNYLPGKVHQLASEVSRSPTAAEFVREYARTHPHWAKNVALHHPKLLAATP